MMRAFPMKRRNFVKLVAAGSMGAAATTVGAVPGALPQAAGAARASTTSRMTVGCQSRRGTSRENLEFLARHGVHHMDPWEPRALEDGRWDLAHARQQVEEAAAYGITIGAYHLPLSSAGIDRQRFPNVMLGKSPERDREIEMLQQTIEVAGRVGVPRMLYNTTILPIVRTGRTIDPARGNASYSTWRYEEAVRRRMHQEPTVAGTVDVDEIYERITYLLDRLLPVAEEYKVTLGNHVADPPLPAGYRGITRWNSPDVFAGIQRFARLYDSPAHGINLCLGSAAEGLRQPRTEILEIIRWLGARRQIVNIHLRNIRGGWNDFQEVYPDNGDMDFLAVVRTLKEVGYTGMLMPDHVPAHDAPGAGDQAFAFAYGHTKALLQAVYGWDLKG
jgi:mannonate dehydratase